MWSCPVQAPCALDLVFDVGAIYTVCLFVSYASPLVLFSALSSYSSPPYSSFPLRIDLLHSRAGFFKRRLNLACFFVFEKYIYILALEMASAGNRHCARCVSALSRSGVATLRTAIHLLLTYLLTYLLTFVPCRFLFV